MKARVYDRINERFNQAGFGALRDRLVADLTGAVLEVGAGTGLNLPRYRRAGSITVLEPSGEYAARLRERAAGVSIPVSLVDGRAEDMALPDNGFDHVVTSISLCSVTDLDRAVHEIRRVLRPGGTLEFLEHVRDEGRRGWWQDRFTPLQRWLGDGCHLNRDPVAAMARAGLRVESVDRFVMPSGNPLLHAGVTGRAVKPAT